ncbi:hypothetical protein [Sphingosinicella terrae]|uniref:hypothetical protein n=1 Tax=Sphingosinicella terrae TaxID=2172047 RepID=UPI000E0DB1DE|nr:hypothetical protein [Sphingosinicella terrae]
MEPLTFIMAILGCGESDAACREVATVETRYASEAECLAATETELYRRDDILYPSVVAQCRPAGARPQLIRGNEVMLPEPPRFQAPARFASAERPQGRR